MPGIRPSPPALTVLCLLHVGPLHPYGMQRLIKEWGKDKVVNVGQRANLYKTIKRLHEAGLISVLQTERDQAYPERTVYELTQEGREATVEWLAGMLATPRNEFPQFPAALSFVMGMPPDQLRGLLVERAEKVRAELARSTSELERYSGALPRVTMLETEYSAAVTAAELAWLDGVVEDLRSGELTWSEELAELAASYLAD